MTLVRGCRFPDELLYDVPNHVWYKPEEGGVVRAGMTPVAIVLAREILVFTPKRVNMTFEKGRSFATVESAKWVGAVRAAFDGTVVAVNEALIANPMIANEDCYGTGWMMLVRPKDDEWFNRLVTGKASGEAYEAWMESEAFPGCSSSDKSR